MRSQANIPQYVKLVSNEHLGMEDARNWYKTVLATAPQGVTTHIDALDINGQPTQTRMIRRSKGESTELIIPLLRDLIPTELEKIADAWRSVAPSGAFTITTNPTQAQKLNQNMDGLNIGSDEYQALCLQLAKQQHASWMREKSADGWGYGPVLSIPNKTHPLMRPWDDLPAQYKDVNTRNPENFLNFLNNQGFAVVRKEELGSLLKILRDIN